MAKKKAPAKKKPAKTAKPAPKAKGKGKARGSASAGMASIPSGGPVSPINSGSGPSPAELGSKLVQMFNSRTPDTKIWDALFAKDFVSIEGHGVNMMFRGRKAVEGKAHQREAAHTVHGARAEGPFVGSTGFAVRFTLDVEVKATGQRKLMDEIGVYSVLDGKIVQEEFMYGV